MNRVASTIRESMRLSSRIYRKLIPLAVRERITPVIYKYYYLARRIFDALVPRVHVFAGTRPAGDLSFAYAGMPEITIEYWAHAVLGAGSRRHSLGRCPFWRVPSFLEKRHFACDFLLLEHMSFTLRFLARTRGFRIPPWVKMEIDTPNLDKKEWHGKRADIERLIRKHHLECEFSRDPAAFDDFYYRMHLPYVKDRFEEAALVEEPRDLEKPFAQGSLILIRQGTDILGGGLIEYLPDAVRLRKIGIRNGNWDYVRLGVIGAIYYFMMLEAERRGCRKVLIGGSRPLMSDGVTRYKLSVNARLVPGTDGTYSWLRLLRDSPALERFLVDNPFVYFPQPDKPRCAIFLDGAQDLTQQKVEKILRACACEGLTGMDLYGFGDVGNLRDVAKSAWNFPLTVNPAHELFALNPPATAQRARPGA